MPNGSVRTGNGSDRVYFRGFIFKVETPETHVSRVVSVLIRCYSCAQEATTKSHKTTRKNQESHLLPNLLGILLTLPETKNKEVVNE
jgi:hypothetical protein